MSSHKYKTPSYITITIDNNKIVNVLSTASRLSVSSSFLGKTNARINIASPTNQYDVNRRYNKNAMYITSITKNNLNLLFLKSITSL